jgi:hypothetical protein
MASASYSWIKVRNLTISKDGVVTVVDPIFIFEKKGIYGKVSENVPGGGGGGVRQKRKRHIDQEEGM